MPGELQTLAVPPNVSLDTLLYNIYLAVQGGGGGTGDVVGPASSTTNHATTFADSTGKLLKDSGITLLSAAVGFTIAGGTTSKTLTVNNTGTAALLEIAQTFTAANMFSANGAASTPALTLNGTVFTGGSSTTTKPLLLIEPFGATSTGWNTGGTLLGVNASSGFTGDLVAFQVNAAAKFRVDYVGNAYASSAFLADNYFGYRNSSYFYNIGDGVVRVTDSSGSNFDRFQFGGTSASFPSLKRSLTTLQCRLADDSGFASIQGKLTTETAYVNTVQVATGYLVIYDSTGTSYRIPALLNP